MRSATAKNGLLTLIRWMDEATYKIPQSTNKNTREKAISRKTSLPT
jgi:hypothetical protein